MANAISKRVAEFIAKFPPFNVLSMEDLHLIAENIVIQYKEPNEYLFMEHASPLENFFLVRQGSVRIFHEKYQDQLIDICDEGDIFGTRPLLAMEEYQASAKTQEESLIYSIPVNLVKRLIEENAQFSEFFALGYASDKPMSREKLRELKNTKADKQEFPLPVLNETMPLNSNKEVLKCLPSNTIAEAAKAMSLHKVGSIIIAENGRPLGIVTDKDLREKVATGDYSVHQQINEIMSSPVICAPSDLSIAEYMILMINKRVHHICITADGSPDTDVTGIIADHDLLLEQGFNPAIVIKEMRKSNAISRLIELRNKADELLKKYIDQQVSMVYIMKMMAGINDVLLCKIIQFSIEKIGQPPVAFAWLSLGSHGRSEQLLRTDQDHALVFEEVDDSVLLEANKSYFLKLAHLVSAELERFGYDLDIANIGAQNADWCLSIGKWKEKFSKWINQPEPENILLSNIFFDFRVAYGAEDLGLELRNHIKSKLKTNQVFLPYLAKNALTNPPPLSFFRNFMLESTGEHKDEFDLKLRALMPLVDAARVLSLEHQTDSITNTAERFRLISLKEKHHYELFLELSDAFLHLIKFRTKWGLENNNSGRYIKISDLTKLERSMLKNIFNLIQDAQKILRLRFHTTNIPG